MKKALPLLALVPLALLAACNTTSGMGKDVQSVGHEVEKAADKAK